MIHVHAPLALEPLTVDGIPVIDTDLNAQHLAHEHAYLEQISGRLTAAHTALRIQTAVLDPAPRGPRDVTIAGTLAAFAETAACDYVVLTTHGRGGLSRFWLGSVASALIQFSHAPLLPQHPQLEASTHAPRAMRRILIPLDGSLQAETILAHALRLGRIDHARYTLLRVVEPLVLLASLRVAKMFRCALRSRRTIAAGTRRFARQRCRCPAPWRVPCGINDRLH